MNTLATFPAPLFLILTFLAMFAIVIQDRSFPRAVMAGLKMTLMIWGSIFYLYGSLVLMGLAF